MQTDQSDGLLTARYHREEVKSILTIQNTVIVRKVYSVNNSKRSNRKFESFPVAHLSAKSLQSLKYAKNYSQDVKLKGECYLKLKAFYCQTIDTHENLKELF